MYKLLDIFSFFFFWLIKKSLVLKNDYDANKRILKESIILCSNTLELPSLWITMSVSKQLQAFVRYHYDHVFNAISESFSHFWYICNLMIITPKATVSYQSLYGHWIVFKQEKKSKMSNVYYSSLVRHYLHCNFGVLQSYIHIAK